VPRVKRANRLVQRLAALHERLPFRRIRQLRDHPGEESKHSAPLHKIKSANRRHADECADQCRADKILSPGRLNQQHYSEQRERGLREYAQS
jgi:hypothetical protein